MKLLRFKDKSNEQTRVGAIKDKNIVDLSEVNLPTDMIDFINLGDEGLETANEFLESSIVGISPDDVFIKSPIKTPNKILAVGLNYKKHIEEQNEDFFLNSNYDEFEKTEDVISAINRVKAYWNDPKLSKENKCREY